MPKTSDTASRTGRKGPSTRASARGDRRKEALLKAAEEEFLKTGYQAASLRSIVRRAGGSSETLYSKFGSKVGLLRAVISAKITPEMVTSLSESQHNRPVEAELMEFTLSYLTNLLHPDAIAFLRMMVAESATMPDIARDFWEVSGVAAAQPLKDYFNRLRAAGALSIENSDLAAQQFLGLLRGSVVFPALLTGETPKDADLERQARQAIQILLHGVMPSGPHEVART